MIRSLLAKHGLRALLLCLPVLFLYIAHFLNTGGESGTPTGFIQYDMAYYIANARQYIDGENAGIFYANPFDFRMDSPRIYFQPLILLIGIFQYLIHGLPALPLLLLGGTFVFLSFLLLSRLVETILPAHLPQQFNLALLTLAWGGGCLAILGIVVSMLTGQDLDPYLFDPGQGTWFLNLGRNFIYPTEAFYHFLVICLFLAVVMRKKILMLALVWLLAMSHPFTGIQYALIVFTWVLFERQFLGSGLFTRRDTVWCVLPVLFCIVYYLLFLPRYASHLSLMEQWSLNWSINLPTIAGAYGIVGLLVLYRCRTRERFIECFSSPFNRFLGICFLVSFALANHEAFITPRQPVHFTRGHIWTPLCLLALPILLELWEKFREKRALIVFATVCWLGLILSDNAVFIYRNLVKPGGIYIPAAHLEAFAYLRDQPGKSVILSENQAISYLSAVYSSSSPYLGHWANTPFASDKRELLINFFTHGTIPPELKGYDVRVITEKFRENFRNDRRYLEVFKSDGLYIFSLDAEYN